LSLWFSLYCFVVLHFGVLMQLKTKEEGETFWEQIEGPANDEQ
jgi:hypothetical protein